MLRCGRWENARACSSNCAARYWCRERSALLGRMNVDGQDGDDREQLSACQAPRLPHIRRPKSSGQIESVRRSPWGFPPPHKAQPAKIGAHRGQASFGSSHGSLRFLQQGCAITRAFGHRAQGLWDWRAFMARLGVLLTESGAPSARRDCRCPTKLVARGKDMANAGGSFAREIYDDGLWGLKRDPSRVLGVSRVTAASCPTPDSG